MIVRLYRNHQQANQLLIVGGLNDLLLQVLEVIKLDQFCRFVSEIFPQQTEGCHWEEQAFLQSIRRAPSDLAPRMAFADWLEEQGDECAGLMRLLCHVAQAEKERDGHFIAADNDIITRVKRSFNRTAWQVSGCASPILTSF